MFENIGSAELLVVLIIVLIFFGPKRIPELARSFGKGMRKFNDAKQGFEQEVRTAMKEPIDSLTQARTNLERQLKETGDPLKDLLTEPVIPNAPPMPFSPPEGSLPRGAAFDSTPPPPNPAIQEASSPSTSDPKQPE
jgi:sec-independent protein translocase protein TatA